MEKKIFYAIYTVSLFLVPFLNHAQPTRSFTGSSIFLAGSRGANNPPVAIDDSAATCQEAEVSIAVQANDSDPDGDLMVTSVISGPSNGSTTIVGTSILYTPDFGFYGTDEIQYVICDNGIPSMCDTATVTITVTQAPVADAGPDQTICFGDVTTIGTAPFLGYTYLWLPSGGLSSNTVAQPSCSPTVPSVNYTLFVHSTHTGCNNTDVVTITVNPLPTANAGTDHTMCARDSTQLGTPGTAGNSYYWTPIAPLNNNSIPQPMASPDSTTTFLLVVTITATGCYSTDSTIVNIIPEPPTNAGPNKTVCIGHSVIIGTPAVAGNIYSWSPATGLSSTTVAQPTATPLVTTTYVLTVTNPTTGCSGTDSVVVYVNPPPLAVTGPAHTICSGDSVMIGAPPIPGNTYVWTPATGLSDPNLSNPYASPTTTTTYTLTESAGVGCSATHSVTITVIPGAVANAGADVSICTGATTVIGIPSVAGFAYIWTPALGLSSTIIAQPTASPTATSTYVLVVTNVATGCVAIDSVTITVLSPPVANAGPDQTICNSDSVMIGTTSVAGETYSWSPATGLSSSTVAQPDAFPTATTTYTLTVSNAGCSDNDQVIVNVNPLPIANAGPGASICPGQDLMLGSPPIAGNTYSWSPATGLNDSTLAQPTATAFVTTTYVLTVSNSGTGCNNTDTVTITILPVPNANAGADVSICTGASTVIGTPAATGFTYSWSPSLGLSSTTAAQPNANPVVTTTYILTMSSGTSICQDTDTITVTVVPLPSVVTGPDQTICQGDTVGLGGASTAGYTYSWSPTTGLSAGTVSNPLAFPAATTTYVLTVTSGPGCVSSDSVMVTIIDTAMADAGPDQNTCVSGPITIGTPAIVGNSYSWSPAAGLSASTIAQPTANPTTTTTYVLTVTHTATGCSGTDTVVVAVGPLTGVDAGNDTSICAGNSITIGGTPHTGSTYSWTPLAGLSSGTAANPLASPLASTTYIMTEINSAGCTGSDTITVTVHDLPDANAGADLSSCQGNSVALGGPASMSYSYSWSPTTGLSSSTVAQPDASPLSTTTYVLTVSDPATGCSDDDSVTVTITPSLVVSAGNDQGLCLSDTCTLGAAPIVGYTYTWTPSTGLNSSTIANPLANPDQTTTYVVTADNGTCTGSDTVVVTVNSLPLGLAGDDQLVCDGNGALLGRDGMINCTYLWSPSTNINSSIIAQPIAMTGENTIYIVSVNDTVTGCTASDSVSITVQGGGFYNGISPNGDGLNDDWTIPMLDCYSSNTVTILNRWGAEVWKASDYNNQEVKWDGQNLDGENLPDGTYYYVIAYNDTEKRGWVFIKR